MTTQRPVFGKKTSAAPQRAARRKPPAKLSPEALAFLDGDRGNADRPYQEEAAGFGGAQASAVAGGKPVWGRRVIARLFDELMIWLVIYVVFHKDLGRQVAAYINEPAGSQEEAAAAVGLFFYALVWALIECVYNIVMEASRLQATLGKLIVGAVVTDRDGNRPGLGGIIMRNTLGRFVVNMVPFYAGYVMGLFRQDRRGLHDLMSGTMVRKREPAAATAGYGEVFA